MKKILLAFTLAAMSILPFNCESNYVPYNDADQNVNLGTHSLTSDSIIANTMVSQQISTGLLSIGSEVSSGPGYFNALTDSNTLGASPASATGVIGNFSQVGAGTTNGFSGNTTFAANVNVSGSLTGPTIANLTPQQIITSASTLTLTNTNYSQMVIFTGSGCTATFPLVQISANRSFFFVNSGTGPVVLNSFSGGNDIWISGGTFNTVTIPPGGTLMFRVGNNKITKFG